MEVQVATPTPPPPSIHHPLMASPPISPQPGSDSICAWLVRDILLPECWARLSRPKPAPQARVRLNARTVPQHLARSLTRWRVRLNRDDIGRYWTRSRLSRRSRISGGDSSSSELESRSSPKPLRVKRALRLKRQAKIRKAAKVATKIAEDDFEDVDLAVKSVLETESLDVWQNAEPEVITLDDDSEEAESKNGASLTIVPLVKPRGAVQPVVKDEYPSQLMQVKNELTCDKPVETEVTNDKPVETEVTNDKPVETAVITVKPVETEVTNDKPVENAVINDKAVENEIVNEKPVESGISVTTPSPNEKSDSKEDDSEEFGVEDEKSDSEPVTALTPPDSLATPSPDAEGDHVRDHDYDGPPSNQEVEDKNEATEPVQSTTSEVVPEAVAIPEVHQAVEPVVAIPEVAISEVAQVETVENDVKQRPPDVQLDSVKTDQVSQVEPPCSSSILRAAILDRSGRQNDRVLSTNASSSMSMTPPSLTPSSLCQPKVVIKANLECPFCFKRFGYRKMYESHLVNEELMETVLSQKHLVRTLTAGWTCLKCSTNQIYLSPVNMVKHVCLDHKLLKEMCEIGLQVKAQKLMKSSDVIKCELCQIQMMGKIFIKHLVEDHFKTNLERMVTSDMAPFRCTYCKKDFDIKSVLTHHLVHEHNLAMQLYQNQIRQRSNSVSQPTPIPATPRRDVVQKPSRVEEPPLKKDQEVYVCVMCRNSINDQGIVFQSDGELRSHLVQRHLFQQVSNEIRKSVERSLKCPESQCQRTMVSLSELYVHFQQTHCPMGVSREMVPGKLAELRKTQCDLCPFHGDDQHALVFHCGVDHPEFLDAILTRLQLGAILQPQRLIPSLPIVPKIKSSASDKKNAAIRNALYYHSPAGRSQMNNLPRQRISTDPAMAMVEPVRLLSILKRPANNPSRHSPKPISHINVKVAKLEKLPTPTSVSVSGTTTITPTTNQGSLTSTLRMFRPKKPHLEDSPNCHLCNESFTSYPEEQRKSLYGKHLFRVHFQREVENCSEVFSSVCKICHFNTPLKSMKVHYFLDHGRIWNLLRNRLHPPQEPTPPKPEPPQPVAHVSLASTSVSTTQTTQLVPQAMPAKDLNAKLAVRFMSDQRTLFIRSIGNVNNFDGAISSVRTMPEIGLKTAPDSPNLIPFNPEVNLTDQEKENIRQIRIKMKTFSHVRHQGQVILQRHACFEIGNISPFCHACATKVDSHTICQFEGFRRIVYKNGLFESAGFKCPYKTPTAEDKALWLPSQCSNPIGMDRETAKFILEYCAPEFLKMADEEREVVETYRRDTQNKVKMIWKPLQEKVREMCDVCSTSLFNVHWTCEECCSIICIDCYKVRKNGGMEYKLNVSAKPHKAQRTMANNRDQHMWPFCHAKKLHLPQNLRLTQMICGDILNEVRDLVFKTRKALLDGDREAASSHVDVETLEPNAITKSTERIRNNDDTNQKALESTSPRDKLNTSPSSGKTRPPHPKDINHYPRCPLCGYPFSNNQKLRTYIHLSTHFSAEILKEIPLSDSPPFACASCAYSFQEPAHLVLHMGMAHNAFDERLRSEILKATSPKNIVLQVDSQPSCTACNMSYLDHQMGKPEIRTHLMMHFRPKLAQLVPEPDHNGMMACPDCPVVFGEKSRLLTHLGIFHKRLDEEWSKEVQGESGMESSSNPLEEPQDSMKDQAIQPKLTYKSDWLKDLAQNASKLETPAPRSTPSDPSKTPSIPPPPAPAPPIPTPTQVPVKKFKLTDYLVKKAQGSDKENSTRSSPQILRKRSCTVCRDLVDTRSISHHWLMHHQDQILSDFAPSNEQQVFTCQICSKKLNPEKVVRHYGLTHEKFAQYSNSKNLMVRNSEPKSKTICPICFDPILTSLTNHLSVHLWLTVHMIRRESEMKMSCAMCSVSLKTGFLDHLLTNHFKEVLNDFWLKDEPNCSYRYAEDANLTKNLMAKLIQIFTNRFCVLCEVDVPSEAVLKTHYVGHLYKDLEDLECKFCDHFPSFDTVSEFQNHFAKEHYEERIQIILEAADRFQFIESLRSKLKIEIPLKSVLGSPSKESPTKATPPQESPTQNCSINSTPKTRKSSPAIVVQMPTRSSSRLSSRSNSVEEEDKMFCQFCEEGHLDEDYFSHMALGHFRAVFERFLPPNPESTHACPRCIFKGESYDELIVHYAEYHQMLAYVLRISEENPSNLANEINEEVSELNIVEKAYQCIPITPEDTLYLCSICGYNSSNKAKISSHVFGHLRTYLDDVLPHLQPHICPICQHESRSRERLIMHYSRAHLSDLTDLKSKSHSGIKTKRRIYKRTIQHDQLTGFHLKMIQGPKMEPKIDMELDGKNRGVFQDLMNEMKQSLKLEKEEEEESILALKFDPEPHVQISGQRLPRIGMMCESSAKYPNVKHEWLCEGRLLVLDDPKDPDNREIFQVSQKFRFPSKPITFFHG